MDYRDPITLIDESIENLTYLIDWLLEDIDISAIQNESAARDAIRAIAALRAIRALLPRLEGRLTSLGGTARDVPARLRTMRDAIDWSYHLLDKPEQRLLARLSVFAGGFSIDAARAVGFDDDARDDDWIAIDRVASLVDQSLLEQQGEIGPPESPPPREEGRGDRRRQRDQNHGQRRQTDGETRRRPVERRRRFAIQRSDRRDFDGGSDFNTADDRGTFSDGQR